jgi:hypothetical protein
MPHILHATGVYLLYFLIWQFAGQPNALSPARPLSSGPGSSSSILLISLASSAAGASPAHRICPSWPATATLRLLEYRLLPTNILSKHHEYSFQHTTSQHNLSKFPGTRSHVNALQLLENVGRDR